MPFILSKSDREALGITDEAYIRANKAKWGGNMAVKMTCEAPRVYNRRRPREVPKDAVYIGRPSPWGNPYRVSKTKTREQAIREFQTYAELKDFYEEDWLTPLRGKNLVCWCSPLPCHGDILLRMANEDIETKRARHAEIGWP